MQETFATPWHRAAEALQRDRFGAEFETVMPSRKPGIQSALSHGASRTIFTTVLLAGTSLICTARQIIEEIEPVWGR
jgi:hypothetical protein